MPQEAHPNCCHATRYPVARYTTIKSAAMRGCNSGERTAFSQTSPRNRIEAVTVKDCGSRMVASRELPSDHDPGKTISKSCENAGSMRKPSGFASCAQKISASKSEDSFGHTAENAADARRM